VIRTRAHFLGATAAALALPAAGPSRGVSPGCIDFALAGRSFARRSTPTKAAAPALPADYRAVALGARIWSDRRTLDVSFLDGTPLAQRRVKTFAALWSAACGMAFTYPGGTAATIRISFARGPLAFSAIGNEALTIQAPEPTMNLSQVTDDIADDQARGVVLHEFGHALGLVHEHQNPAAGIDWDRPAAYAFYGAKPYFLSPPEVDAQILDRYDRNQTQYTQFDTSSIMIYPIPGLLTHGRDIAMNTSLSFTDRSFASKLYPT
jgi:serralysin